MRKVYLGLLTLVAVFCLAQCDSQTKNKQKNKTAEETPVGEESDDIKMEQAQNEKAWKEARELSFVDTDFLKTKQPMSADAVAPFDPKTGKVGDRAYNRRVYVEALSRLRKHLEVKDNQLVNPLKSGADILVADDLYEYTVKILEEWNQKVKKGEYKIIKDTEDGYYSVTLNI